MALMDELIARLERLDRFEDSVVVIQGDHGASFALDGEGVLEEPRARPVLRGVEPGPLPAVAAGEAGRRER